MQIEKYSKVIEVKNLTDSTYILRFERNDISFEPGQHIGLGLPNNPYMRDYSIYSANTDDYIEVLIKEVINGNLSVKLKDCQVGSLIKYDEPYGHFLLDQNDKTKKYTFIATGTGISPFHSFVKSYPKIDYSIFHGVRYAEEGYEQTEYATDRYHLLTSQDPNGPLQLRVTDYLRTYPIDMDADFFLCGNGSMIYEVNDILQALGASQDRIFFEIYF